MDYHTRPPLTKMLIIGYLTSILLLGIGIGISFSYYNEMKTQIMESELTKAEEQYYFLMSKSSSFRIRSKQFKSMYKEVSSKILKAECYKYDGEKIIGSLKSSELKFSYSRPGIQIMKVGKEKISLVLETKVDTRSGKIEINIFQTPPDVEVCCIGIKKPS